MNKNKKLMVVLSLCMVAVISIGVTYALLSKSTNEEVNKFNILDKDGFGAELVEDAFNDKQKEDALKVVPGSKINKDPKIVNISKEDGMEIWTGMRMIIRKGDGSAMSGTDMDLMNRVLDITIDDAKWERKTGGTSPLTATEIYYYRTKVGFKGETSSLFTQVKIKDTATSEDLAKIRDEFKGFEIVVKGAAVQVTEGSTLNDATKTSIDNSFDK